MDVVPDTKDWTWVLQRPCPECGLDTREISPEQVAPLLRSVAASWVEVLGAATHVGRRPAAGVWSLLEYACHVRDVLTVFDERLLLMLTAEDPLFADWDQDSTALAQRYGEQDARVVGPQLRRAAQTLAAHFDEVRGARWQRPGRRGDGARFTVATLARYLVHDPVHHLYDVTGRVAGTVEGVHPRTRRLLERIRAAEGADGRLPLPDMADWDIFPLEGAMVVKHVDDPVVPEPQRAGEGAAECAMCAPDLAGRALWSDEGWLLLPWSAVPGIPVAVMLVPREHYDLEDLPGELAAGLGPLIVRVVRSLRSIGGIGRVHVNKWGDGGAHLHLAFLGRPEGLLQMRGSCLDVWDDVLPRVPPQEWAQTLAEVTAAMRG